MSVSRLKKCQYTLMTLSLIVTLLCVGPFSWIAYERTRAGNQQNAVESLQKRGALIYSTDASISRSGILKQVLGDNTFNSMTNVFLDDPTLTDKDLVHLDFLPNVRYLLLGPNMTNKGFHHIRHLRELRCLDMGGTQVTDDGLKCLQNLVNLNVLCLNDTQISDVGLEYLRGNTKMRELMLSGTSVTDNGLLNLISLRELTLLDLSHTIITDSGLMHLKQLTSLRKLNIRDSRVTALGVERFRRMQAHVLVLGSGEHER